MSRGRAARAAAVAAAEAALTAAATAALRSWCAQVAARALTDTLVADAGVRVDPTMPGRMSSAWAELATGLLAPAVQRAAEGTVRDELAGSGAPVDLPWVERYTAGLAGRWAGVPARTSAALTRALAAAEDPARAVAEALTDAGPGSFTATTAALIGRTEATGAVNGALAAAWSARAAETGARPRKTWLAHADEAGRPEHAALDGAVVDLDTEFLAGGARLAHPGDPGGGLAQAGSCRCLLDDVDPAVDPASPRSEAAAGSFAHRTAAIVAAGGNQIMAKPRTWSGLLAPIGVNSGDRRRLAAGGDFSFRELPLPLMFQEETGYGHDDSVVVGRILTVQIKDDGIYATGDYLTAPEFAENVGKALSLAEAGLGHVSVDMSDVTAELSDADGNQISDEDMIRAFLGEGEMPELYDQFTAAKLIGVTQVAKPAFEGAKINLDADDGVDDDQQIQTAGAEETVLAAEETPAVEDAAGEVVAAAEEIVAAEEVVAAAEDTVLEAATEAPAAEEVAEESDAEFGARQLRSLAAAAGNVADWRPDGEVFANPQLAGLTPMTIGPADENGMRRVFGHAAGWQTCHIAYGPNKCVTPPKEDDFAFFHVGEVELADGGLLPVGNLTLGGRHADPRAAYRDAVEHYDDSGAGVAVVRAYADEFGIAVAGVLTPETTEAQVRELRRSVLSGDWRRIGGEMRLCGALAVNTGGFPVPRTTYAFDEVGRQLSLVAAGVVPQELATQESFEEVARRVFADERAREARRAEVAELAASVIDDAVAAELAELLAEVDGVEL